MVPILTPAELQRRYTTPAPTSPDPRQSAAGFQVADDGEMPLAALARLARMLREQARYVPEDYWEARFAEWAAFIDVQRRRLEASQ